MPPRNAAFLDMPYGDCLFSIAGGGVVDAVDA